MRISDWSSDVCASDLRLTGAGEVVATLAGSCGDHQGSLDVSRAVRVESLLLQAGALERVESLAPVIWAALAAGAEVGSAEVPSSLLTVSGSVDAPCPPLRSSAPPASEALPLLSDPVLPPTRGALSHIHWP